MDNEIIYDIEKINSILNEMRTLISDSKGIVEGLSAPSGMIGSTKDKLEQIVELYIKLFDNFSTELVEKLSEYAAQKSDDMVEVDSQ